MQVLSYLCPVHGDIITALSDERVDKAQFIARERRPEQNGLQFSTENSKRRRVPNELW